MNCLKRLQRLFAGVIVVTFFVTNTLTPAPVAYGQTVENFPKFFSENSFKIPAEFGKITDSIKSSEGGSLLIHIQEAHANYDAQKNIQNILQYLSKNYGIQLVLLEGAGNKLTPEPFRFFPKNAQLQHSVNEKLMQAGELTGAEVFMIDQLPYGVRGTKDAVQAEAYGIENAAAYAKDRESYRKVYEGRGASDLFLKGVYLEWQKEASLRLNPELRELITRYAAFDEGTVPLESWLETLKKSSNTILRNDLTDVKAQLAWPTLVRYFRLRSLDGKIDLSKVEAEKATFLRDIAKYGVQSTEYGEKKLGDEMNAMFEMAKKGGLPLYKTRFVFERLMDALPADFSFNAYPNLRLRIQQMILISELQSEVLQSEIKKLTASLVEVLVKTDEEKTLVRSLREYQLLKKLFHLELSRGEYQQVLSRQISPSELMQALDRVRGKESAVRDTLPALQQLNEQALNFYSGAIEREDFMMKRAREVMKERKQTKAVIITGGFHTEGFKQAITASGSSYIGIMPSIGEITADSNKNYLTALLGSNAITRSHIAPEKVTQQVSFFSAVSPRFWRRELAVRFARIRDIVRETVASYHDRSAENRAEFDAGFKKIIASAVGVSPRQSQPQPSGLFRPELRAARVDVFFKTLGEEIDATYGGVKILPADDQYLGVISFDGTLPADPNFWGFVLHPDHSLEYRVVGSEGRVSFRAGLEKTELSVQGAQDATPKVLQAYQGEFPIVAILRKREDNSIRIVEKSVRFATGSFDELGLGKFIRLTPFLQDQKSNETEQAYRVLARMTPESPSLAMRPVGHAAPAAGSPRAEVRSNPILPVMSSKDGKVEIHGDRADFSSTLEFPDSAARDAFLNAGNFRVYLRWGNSKQKESWTFSEASMQSYGLPANQVKLLGSAFTTPYYNWKDYEGIFLLVPAATDDPSRALMESKDRLPEGVYRWLGPNIQTNLFLAPRAEARDKAVGQIREVIEAIRGQQSQINAENFRMVRKMLNKILEDVYKGGRNDLVLSAVGAVAAPITQALETFQKTKEPQTLLFQGALDKLLQNFFSKAEDEDIGPMVHTLTHRIGVAAFVAGVGPVGPGELPDEIMLASNFNEADFLKGLEGVGKSVLPDFLRNHKAVVHLSERAAEFQGADALAVEIPAGDGSLPGDPKVAWQLFIDTLIRQFRAHEGLMDMDAQRGDQALHIDPAGLKRSQSFSMESWSRDQILGSVVTILFFPRSEVRNMGEVPLNLEGIKGKMNVRVTRGGKVGTVKGYGGGKEPFLEILFDGESDIQPFYLRGSASVGKPLLFASEVEELGSRKAAEAEAQKAASELAKTWTKTTGLAKGAIALIKKESLVNQSADRMYVHSRWMKKIAIASSSAMPPKNLGEEEEDRKMTDAEYAQDLQGLVEAFWGAYNGRAKERYLFSNATGVERFVLWKILGHELAGDVFFSAFNLRERLKDEKGKTAWQIRSKLKYGRISDKTIEEIWGEARPGNSKAPVAVARWNEGGFDVQSAVLRAIPVVERILQAEVQKGLEIGITLKPRPMDEIPSVALSQKSPGKAVRSEVRAGKQAPQITEARMGEMIAELKAIRTEIDSNYSLNPNDKHEVLGVLTQALTYFPADLLQVIGTVNSVIEILAPYRALTLGLMRRLDAIASELEGGNAGLSSLIKELAPGEFLIKEDISMPQAIREIGKFNSSKIRKIQVLGESGTQLTRGDILMVSFATSEPSAVGEIRAEMRGGEEVPLNLKGVKGMAGVRVERAGRIGTVESYGGGSEPYVEIRFDGALSAERFYMNASRMVGKPIRFAGAAEDAASIKRMEEIRAKAAQAVAVALAELNRTWPDTRKLAVQAIEKIRAEGLLKQTPDKMYVAPQWMQNIKMGSLPQPPKELKYGQSLQALVNAFWGDYNGRWGDPQSPKRYLLSNATGFERVVLWKLLGREFAGDVFYSAMNMRDRLKIDKAKAVALIQSKLNTTGQISDAVIVAILNETDPHYKEGQKRAPAPILDWFYDGLGRDKIQDGILRAIPVVERILQTEFKENIQVPLSIQPRPLDEIPTVTLPQGSTAKFIRSEIRDEGQPTAENRTLVESIKDPFDFSKIEHLVTLSSGKTAEIFPGITIRLAETKLRQSESQGSQAQFEVSSTLYDPSRGASMPSVDLKWRDVGFEFKSKIPSGTTGEDLEFTLRLTGVDSLGQAHFTSSRVRKPAFSGGFRSEKRANRSYSHLQFEKEAILAFSGAGFAVLGLPVWNATGPSFTLMAVSPQSFQKAALSVAAELAGNFNPLFLGQQLHINILPAAFRSAPPTSRKVRSEVRNDEAMTMPVHDVVHIAMESADFFGKGGVKDVVREKPPALLKHLGAHQFVIMPGHPSVFTQKTFKVENAGFTVKIPIEGREETFEVYTAVAHSVRYYFIKKDGYFQKGYWSSGSLDGLREYAVFSRAAVEILRKKFAVKKPDIIHLHDAHPGLVAAFIRAAFPSEFQTSGITMTIHNADAAYQQRYGPDLFNYGKQLLMSMGMPEWAFGWKYLEFHGGLNLMKAGLVFSEKFMTVSPKYREELLADPDTGLQGVFLERKDDFTGILNGVDSGVWNPSKDNKIYQKYTSENVAEGKRANKLEFQKEVGLQQNPNAMLFVAATRLADQKGPELILEEARRLLNRHPNAQIAVIGEENHYAEGFRALMAQFPGRAYFTPAFSETLVRKAHAAEDFFLMPSKFEPCGLGQMQALRYGGIPIVHAVGGLDNTVLDPKEDAAMATGFKFYFPGLNKIKDLEKTPSFEAVMKLFDEATERAVAVYMNDPQAFYDMRARGMNSVRDWDELVPEFKKLYETARFNAFHLNGIPLAALRSEARAADPAAIAAVFMPHYLPTISELAAFISNMPRSISRGVQAAEESGQLLLYALGSAGYVSENVLPVIEGGAVGNGLEIAQAMVRVAQKANSKRAELRSWAEKNAPELEDYTVVTGQLEAGLDREILKKLEEKYGKTIAGLVAATTVTGGLGALMHDLFPSWQKNFGQPKKANIDAFAVNVIYDRIKGQEFAKDLPEEVTSGKKTLGDYLREVLTEDPGLSFSIFLDAGNEYRAKAEEWIGRAGDPLYKKRLQQAREAVDREIKVKVYPTNTFSGGMPNFYIEAFYIADDGTKVQIFDEVYPDTRDGGPNLWRDLHLAVYGKTKELLTLKLQEKGIAKKKILFVDNEVFASIPTPLFPDAPHHHMNHSVYSPTIYRPAEASFQLLGYPQAMRSRIIRNGTISIVDAVGISYDLVTGVALYEHTPAVSGGVMPGYVDVIDSFNQGGLRSTNGVLLEQWQAPFLRQLINTYKAKLGMSSESDDRDFFIKIGHPGNEAFLGEFKERTDMIKSYLAGRLMLWLKASQNKPEWFDQAMKSYQEEFGITEVDGPQVVADLQARIQKALEDESEWQQIFKDPKAQALRKQFLLTAIVSNVRRQVSYKGPDKWLEILRSLAADPAKLEQYKKTAARAIIGGREFDDEAHGLFLEIQRLIRELKLEDKFATIENYNIKDAPIIFQGVSGTVMITYMILEASATSMMKGLPNGAILMGAWGGAQPELFTIVDNETGLEKDIFRDKITYEQVVENLKSKKWKITNGFLVFYSKDGDGKFILSTLDDNGNIKVVNAPYPLAESMIEDLIALQKAYAVSGDRMNLQWEALRSSPLVDMEKSQARAHIKLWQRVVQKSEKQKALLAKPGLSAESALRFLSKKSGNDGGFVWRSEPSNALEIAPPGVLTFVESARQVRTHGVESYKSIAYHAARGEIFAKILYYFEGFEKEAPDFYQEMMRLKAEADKTNDLLEKVRIHLAALRLFDRFVVQLSETVLQGYIQSRSKEYERLFRDELFRQNLYFLLESKGKRFGSLNKKLVGFGVQVGDKKYIIGLNLGEQKYPAIDGGESKAWGQFYGNKAFQWLTDMLDPEAAMTYHIVNTITGEVYGAGEERKPYPLSVLMEGALPIGVPDFQILELQAAGVMKPEKKREQRGSLILDDLRSLVSGNSGEQLRQQKPRTYWLKRMIQGTKPEDLKMLLQTVSGIGRDKAHAIFGVEGVRPVMAFIATLVPELLEDMKEWDAEVYGALKNMMQSPETKDLFERGEVFFLDSSRDTAVVLARVLKEEKDGFEHKRHVVVPIHFSKVPYNKEEGKVWFGVGSISLLGLESSLVYQTRDHMLQIDYEKKHTLSSIQKEGWRVGISVVKRKDPAGIAQLGWRFQVLQMVPVGVNSSEGATQGMRSEARTGTSDAGTLNAAWPQHEAQKIAVIGGAGFVGATEASMLSARFGHDVTAVDIKPASVASLNGGKLVNYAPGLEEFLQAGLAAKRLRFTTNLAGAIEGREIIYLALPTPYLSNGESDTHFLEDAVADIARLMKPGEKKIIIGKSTAPPETIDRLKARIHQVGLPQGAEIEFAWIPEFLREGLEVEDALGGSGRMAVGAEKPAIADRVAALYDPKNINPQYPGKPIPIFKMGIKSAMLVKYAANGYRAWKISFINHLSWYAALFGFNVKKVAEKLGADPRIRPMFLSAGIGWGGSCFPKDSLSFMRQLAKAGMPFGLMMDTFAVNEAQWQMFANGIKQKLDGVKDKTVVVLGAAFKPNTSDDREARSILIIRQLVEWGAQVRVYDPVAIPSLQKTLADLNPAPGTGTAAPVQYFQNPEDLYSMMEGASAIVLVTEWDAFRQLNFKKVQTMFPDREKRPLVFDGRNAWDPAEVAGFGFQYFGISHETLPSPFVGETGTSLTRGMDEFVKKAIEFFLAGRIAFMISLAELAERSGGDIRDILKGLGADPVVGDLYLKPGIGFGGFDLFAALEKFTKFAESHSEGLMDKLREYREQIEILKRHYGFSGSNGTDTRVPFVTAFAESNERAVKLYVDKTREAVGGNLSGKTVTLLGLAYKPGPNSSIENAPSLKLIEALLAQGAKVRVTDAHPATASSVRNHFSKRAMDLKGVEFFDHKTNAAENAREAIRGSDAQILVTEWPEYADWRTLFFEGGMTEASGKSVTEHFNVVDGRHFYDPYELEANGFHYFAVGIPSQKEKKTVVLPGAAKAELAGAIEFPEKGVRIEPQASGRFQLKLLVRMKHEALQRARFFVHFGPRGKGTSVPPWHDQEIPGEGIIKPLQQAGEKGVYELVAEIDPREKYPQFTGAFGATVFLLPSDVTLQDAAFHTERIWAQQAGGVRDGEFSVSEQRSEMRDTQEIQTTLGAKKISANAKKVVGLLKESPSNAFWTEAQAQMDSLLQSDQPAVELPRIAENFKGGKIVTARGASACVFFGKDQEAAVQKMTQIQAEIQGALGPRVLTVPQDELHLTLQGLKHGVTAAEVDNGFLRKTTEALRQAFRSSSVSEVHGKLIGPYWHRDLGVVMIWKADGKEDPLAVVQGTIAKHLGLGNPPRPFHVTLVYPVQGRMTAEEFADFYRAVGKVPVQQIPITISGFEINSYQDIAFTAVRRVPKATIPLQRSEARGVSIEELLRGERPEGMINVHPAQGFRNQLVSHRAFFEGTVTPLQVRNWNAKNATVAASMTSYDGKWFLGITHEGRTEDGVAAISLDLKKYFGADFSSNFYILRDRGTRFWKGALEWPHENDLTFIRTPDEMKPLNVILRPGQFHFFEILPVPSSDEMIYAKIAGIKRFVKADGFEYSKLGALQPLVPHQTGNFYRFQNGQLLTQPIDMGQMGQKVEGDSDLSFYVGPQIEKYLRALAAGEVAGGFAGEIQIYNVQGGAVKIKVNHGNYREVIELNERGVIVIKDLAPGVTLDLLDLSGAEFMIHMRKAPPWFKDFGSEDFRALPHPGPDRSAVVSNEKLQELGVLVIALSDKQNFMYASSRMPTQWANSAYTHFRKADGKDQFLWNGASLIREDAPQERSFPGRDLSRYDEKLYGDRERVHSHRSSLEHEGKRAQAIELYYVADGAMGFYIKTQHSKEYVMKVQAGDTIVIDPEVIHAIAYVKLPYAHVAVQSPSVWHLGMAGHEFKQFYGPVQDLLESRPGVRDEILHFMNAPQAGIMELNKRSELRSAEETKPSSPVAGLRDFFEDNFRRGGGREQGIRGVTEKLADGIVSLLAYTNKAKDIILSNLIPAAYAGEPVTLTREPKNFFSKLKIKMLYRALGVKTIQASDALVLDPETAFKRGLIYVIRNVFGAIPVVVLSEKGSTDRVFLEKINQQLRQANRPTILSAANLDEARELLATDREAAPIRDSWNLKAMVFAGAHNPQTALLAEELKENIVTIDQKMFRNFLNLAGLGVSKFVEQMQAEYFATAKSA